MTEPACYRVPLEHYPGMNRFVLDWVRGDERFLPRKTVLTPSRAAGPPITPSLVDALIDSNRRWGVDVADALRRWADGGTHAIIAGQQTGFAGGPLYTLAKIATLLKMKRDQEAKGVPTTLFFWLATEDHDYDEVATIALPNDDPRRQTDLLWLRAPRLHESRQPVGPQAVPEELIEAFVAATGIERPRWLRPGIGFGDSFAELLSLATGGEVIFVDSLLPQLRQAGSAVVEKILGRWHDVQNEIEARSEALRSAGYTPQVIPRPGEPYTLLFRLDQHGNRELLHDPAEAGAPDRLLTSALTRPLLQDFVFQPDTFVGGPAEVAYFAQITSVHALLDVPLPRVALRGHVLVAPRATVRRFAKYSIAPEDVFTSAEALLAGHEAEAVAEVRSIAAEAERQLLESIERIRALALPADHAVARSIHRAIGHIDYHFHKLADRAVRGIVRKDRERFAAARDLVSAFHPDHHVQDRVVAWSPFWFRYGQELLARLVAEIEPDAPLFKIVGL